MGTFVFSRLPLKTTRSFTASISSQCPAQGLLGAGGKEDDSPRCSLCRHSIGWLSTTLSPAWVSSSVTGEQRRFHHLWWYFWDLRFVGEALIYLQLGEHSSPSLKSLVVGILGDLGVLSGGPQTAVESWDKAGPGSPLVPDQPHAAGISEMSFHI